MTKPKVYSAYIQLSSTSLLFSSFSPSSPLSLFNLLHSLPLPPSNKHALLSFLSHRDPHHNSFFSESAKFSKNFPLSQSSIQNAVSFRRHCVPTAFPWSGLVWNGSRQLSIESIIEFNKGQMSFKVKTFSFNSHCSKFPYLS